jgi:hypothetical protein
MVKTGPVTIDGGEFVLVAGDIDFVGIAALATGDIVTLTTTPLELVVSRDLDVPDTIAGVFDSNTADPTADILCMGDNTANNDLDTGCGAGLCPGLGSLCRFEIPAPGDYYVGVTGFRPTSPGGCTPGVDCTTAPFDGGITPGSPCEESNGATITCGNYQVTIAVHSLPEPGVILQLASGLLSLLVLDKRRRRANR